MFNSTVVEAPSVSVAVIDNRLLPVRFGESSSKLPVVSVASSPDNASPLRISYVNTSPLGSLIISSKSTSVKPSSFNNLILLSP
ncbi:hypothetical protein D3C75_1020440 [compost metagenome]